MPKKGIPHPIWKSNNGEKGRINKAWLSNRDNNVSLLSRKVSHYLPYVPYLPPNINYKPRVWFGTWTVFIPCSSWLLGDYKTLNVYVQGLSGCGGSLSESGIMCLLLILIFLHESSCR